MPKRLCTICGKQLASEELNPEDICFCHQPGMLIEEKTPVTNCTSFNAPTVRDLLIPKPGDEAYNDIAYETAVVGIINLDGEEMDLDEWINNLHNL